MSPDMHRMMTVAQGYCHLIENCCRGDGNWLKKVAEHLSQLHAAILHIKDSSKTEVDAAAIDLDARFDLYVRLKQQLGEDDAYWMEFDVNNDYQQMSGSLADDLTDIYCELKQGLDLLDRSPPQSPHEVMGTWGEGYRLHWGQHLLDAERHLYALEAQGRL